MKSQRFGFVLFLLMLLLLFSFGCEQVIVPVSREIHFDCGASYNPDATDITVALEYGESRLLERFPNLSSVNLTGSEDVAEVREFAAAHPEISVRCDLSLLGQTVAFDATTLTVSGSFVVSDIQQTINALPNLTSLDLRACKLDNISLLKLMQDNPDLCISCMAEVFGALWITRRQRSPSIPPKRNSRISQASSLACWGCFRRCNLLI